MRVSALVLVVATGCFSKPGFGGGGGGDGGTDPTSWGDFMGAQPVANVAGASGSDFAPTVWSNDGELFFSSERFQADTPPQPNRILVAKRTTGTTFDAPNPINTQVNEAQVHGTISADGLDLFCQTSSYQQQSFHRNDPTALWLPGTKHLPPVGPADLGAHDLRLVAGSAPDHNDPGSALVEYARTSLDAGWDPVQAPMIPTSMYGDTSPTLSQDGLEMFYEAHTAQFGSEIHRSARTSLDRPFETAEVVTLTPDKDLGDPELSTDGRTLYFRVLIGGDYQLYYATRKPD
ncbi:MAG: hypothetical protein IPQ07_22220 [Myxococcales bacterium]|nr:hypothetical protein [Myxococcales bacterium]